MTIQEMIARQQAIVDGARKEGRGLTREEQTEFDQIQGKIDAARNAGGQDGNQGGGEPLRRATAAQEIQAARRARAETMTQPARRRCRRNASATATLWPCAGRWAWIRRSTSAAARPWTRCARRRWSL